MKKVNITSFKLKNATGSFLCALCGNDREVKYKRTLSWKNYFQVVLIASLLTLMTFPWLEFKGLFVFPIVWFGFELIFKMLFRKEISCPHCGFDPVWYCKDVRVAKSLVKDFWKPKDSSSNSTPEVE